MDNLVCSTMLQRSGDQVPTHGRGSIGLLIGPMFAGKTSEMMRLVERHNMAGRKCLIVKYSGDKRYSEDEVVTHRGVRAMVTTASTDRIADVDCSAYGVIGIDEGQFYPDIVDAANRLADSGKIVIISYLDATYERKPFGPLAQLVASAEYVQKLAAVCTCGDDAHYSKRMTADTELEVIGGADKYRAVCRKCYVKP